MFEQKSKLTGWTWINLLVAFLLLVIALTATFLSDWFVWLKPSTDSAGVWFERSGAVTTIFALLAINLIDDLKEQLAPSNKLANLEGVGVLHRFEGCFVWVKRCSFLLTIWGALVWGYGTLMLPYFG